MVLKEKQFTLCLMAAILRPGNLQEDAIEEAFAMYEEIQKRLILDDIPKPSGE